MNRPVREPEAYTSGSFLNAFGEQPHEYLDP
jgi:hypothetical protein